MVVGTAWLCGVCCIICCCLCGGTFAIGMVVDVGPELIIGIVTVVVDKATVTEPVPTG